MEKLIEEVVSDGQHLRHLIGICEGNDVFELILRYFRVILSLLASWQHESGNFT